jgi:hypothetical protein
MFARRPCSRLELGVAIMHVSVLEYERAALGRGSRDAGTLAEVRAESVVLGDVCGGRELRDRRLGNHAGRELGSPALWISLREGQLAFRQGRPCPMTVEISSCRAASSSTRLGAAGVSVATGTVKLASSVGNRI